MLQRFAHRKRDESFAGDPGLVTRRSALERIGKYGLAATATAGLTSLVGGSASASARPKAKAAGCWCYEHMSYKPNYCCGGPCPKGSCCYENQTESCLTAKFMCVENGHGYGCTSGWNGWVCLNYVKSC
jgi:hypothetical protein